MTNRVRHLHLGALPGPLLTAAFMCALALPRVARADDVSGAANAFSRAQKAELSGDFAGAAEFYELADGLAPAPEALRSALRARKSAGQLETAALHAEELLARYSTDTKSTELANSTLEEAAKSLMRYEIVCRPTACTLLVDGAAAGADAKELHVVYLTPGKHAVKATFGKTQTDALDADGVAGDKKTLTFDQPPEPPSPPAGSDLGDTDGVTMDQGVTSRGGLSPWYFASGAIATAGLGAATIWSGLDVLSAHDTYKKNPTQTGYDDGKSRETRTNILIGATSVVGVATGVLALFTDWGGKHRDAAGSQKVRAYATVTSTSAGIVVGGVY
jgi:hypothetical protein